MAWIESHQELARHPKTKKLARLIGVSLPAAVGHLHFLWWWAMDYAEDGDLSKFDVYDIADACGWDGDAEQLFNGLCDAGFIDREDGVRIHDWDEYAGRLLEKRKQNTERKRKSRSSHARQPRDNGDGHGATEPNQTVPNQTEPNHTTTAAHVREGQSNSTKTYYEAYRRTFSRDLTPYQYEQLGKYINDEGIEEAVVVRAIERAAIKGGNFNLILKILNDYADGGAKTLQGAVAYDEQFEQSKVRASPANRQASQISMLNQLEREFAGYDTG